MNQRHFLDEPMCLCEMFTSPHCWNRKDNRHQCFACLLGGTKRNWFNLEERRFCLDVRKNFEADRGARAQLRTMCHWGLSRRGWAAAVSEDCCTRPGICPQQSYEVFVFGFMVYSVQTINKQCLIFKSTERFSFPPCLNVSEKTNPPKNYPNQNLLKERTALISMSNSVWGLICLGLALWFLSWKRLFVTQIWRRSLSTECQTLRAAC